EAKAKNKWSPKRADIGIDLDLDATMLRATTAGHESSPFARIVTYFSGHKILNLDPVWTVDSAKIKEYLNKRVASKIRHEAHNARFLALEKGFKIEPGRPGLSLDADASVNEIVKKAESTSAEPV